MGEKYYVINDKEDIEYYIIKKENNNRIKYTLRRSNSELWNRNVRNELLFTIIDNKFGDCKIKIHGKSLNELNYHELIELGILLDFVNNDAALPSKYDFIKKELK